MKRKVRRGLILVVGLGVLSVVLAQPTNKVEFLDIPIPEMKRKIATQEEKRENRRITRSYAKAGWGWDGKEWVCLRLLWKYESRFDHLAQNQTSSAFGIPQLIGMRDREPQIQVLKGLRYIEHRFGSPCRAWSYWLKHKHY